MTHAKAVIAAETMGVAFADWIEGALQGQLERDRQTLRDRQFHAVQKQREAEGKPTLHRHEWEADQKRR